MVVYRWGYGRNETPKNWMGLEVSAHRFTPVLISDAWNLTIYVQSVGSARESFWIFGYDF